MISFFIKETRTKISIQAEKKQAITEEKSHGLKRSMFKKIYYLADDSSFNKHPNAIVKMKEKLAEALMSFKVCT
ncbi:hypothetical protein A6B38_03945 [Bartonella bacilliformis]|uniref:Uncharacterized protein n=1 Tax=Bartonella bacilliformis INS TaxID=1206782 RepID=A0ABN0IFT7_BARBA|nr:hypothetical protein AL467_04085 [Bartonella bacilliformis]EKS43870.1 hypothetical protein BbINS_04011 [Bartonella bacilliformis INS]KZN21796.1 hypothetical protein A6B38_03945 [Bartonella bacilliformis]